MERKVYEHIATMVDARLRCLKNAECQMPQVMDNGQDVTVQYWRDMAQSHAKQIINLEENYLPSGSGWNNGTRLDFTVSTPNHLVLHGGFHHMDEHGYYDGWTDHTIHIRPSLMSGIDLRITGPDRNNVKEYLYEMFEHALSSSVEA